MDDGKISRDPSVERPPWLRQMLRSRRASQPPVQRNFPNAPSSGSSPSGRLPAAGRFVPPGQLPGAPSSGLLGRVPSSGNLNGWRDLAAEQTAMMDIARTDLVACPRCGAANYDNAARCAECGYVLLITCPRCGLVNRTGAIQCARCALFLSQPTGAPRTGAYGVAARASHPLLPLPDPPPVPFERTPQRSPGRWALTAFVSLILICALVVALAEAFPPVNDTIANLTHLDIHAMVSGVVDWILGLLPH